MKLPIHNSLVLALLFSLTAGMSAAVGQNDERAEELRKQVQRIQRLNRLAIERKISPAKKFRAIHEPLIEKNREAHERNRRLARKYEREAERASNESRIKNYTRLAKIFDAYAEQNKRIVQAIRKNRSDKLNDAFEKVKKLEDFIFQETGRNYERDWYMPEELAAAVRQMQAKRQKR